MIANCFIFAVWSKSPSKVKQFSIRMEGCFQELGQICQCSSPWVANDWHVMLLCHSQRYGVHQSLLPNHLPSQGVLLLEYFFLITSCYTPLVIYKGMVSRLNAICQTLFWSHYGKAGHQLISGMSLTCLKSCFLPSTHIQ